MNRTDRLGLALTLLTTLAACGNGTSGGMDVARPGTDAATVDDHASDTAPGIDAVVDVAVAPTDGAATGDTAPAPDVATAQDTGTGCGASEVQCPNGCANINTDPANCGSCGLACPAAGVNATATCSAGTCGFSCPTGDSLCGNNCDALQTDVHNCGACGTACAAGASCVAGACTCPAGQSPCHGTCVNLQDDLHNCGACGTTCTLSGGIATCLGGSCGGVCPAGQWRCGSTCADLNSDPNHCGDCGIACPTGGYVNGNVGHCNSGVCWAGRSYCSNWIDCNGTPEPCCNGTVCVASSPDTGACHP